MSKAVRQTSGSASSETGTKKSASKDSPSGQEMMQAVLSKPTQVGKAGFAGGNRIDGVVIGTLCELSESGQALVHYEGIPTGEPLPAFSTEQLTNDYLGREVALSFVEGDPAQPLILGLIQESEASEPSKTDQNVDVHVDGETLTLTADREIVLKCGKSSITLTKAGKIIVKGAYLSNHSTGVNRIKGGSVQIN